MILLESLDNTKFHSKMNAALTGDSHALENSDFGMDRGELIAGANFF